ncbi:MAG TPA: AI-2E family transporter [Candidatus Ventricola gallistercoris]|nr:AI-2E family transporter [Candidatus Ventricola gallistercoris]
MQFSRDTKRFLFLLSAFTVGLALLVRHFSSIGLWFTGVYQTLVPFIVGACLAFLLNVPMHMFDALFSRKFKGRELMSSKVRRPVCLILSLLLVLLLIVLFSIIVLPQLVNTVSSLAGSVMNFVPTGQMWITRFTEWLSQYPEALEIIYPYIPDVNQIASTIIAFVQRYAGLVVSTVVSQASSFFGNVTNVIIMVVFAVYVLLQKDALSRQGRKLIYAFLPKRFCDSTLRVAHMAYRTFFSYVTIQCTEACILGSLCFVGMLLFRFPYAVVISVIMLFCALIPIYGAIFSCIVGAFLVLFENPAQAPWFVLFILVLQQVETNLIYPRVVSTSINLPSMWVLLAVTAGGGLFGIAGMIMAVPLTSIAYTLLGEITRKRLIERHLSPDNPAAPDETQN